MSQEPSISETPLSDEDSQYYATHTLPVVAWLSARIMEWEVDEETGIPQGVEPKILVMLSTHVQHDPDDLASCVGNETIARFDVETFRRWVAELNATLAAHDNKHPMNPDEGPGATAGDTNG
jgi:hypothetical protein